MKKIKNNLQYFMLLFSMIIGMILGLVLKEDAIKLRPIGNVFINMMFTIVVPLIFFTISRGISNLKSYKKLSRILRNTFLVFIVTGIITGIFALISGLIFNPLGNANISLGAIEKIEAFDFGKWIVDLLTVEDFPNLLSRTRIVPLIVFSLLFGLSTGLVGEKGAPMKKLIDSGFEVTTRFVKLVMYYAPIGLCAYFAALIGEYGPAFIGTYARIGIMYLVLGVINILVFHTIYMFISGGKEYVKRYYKNMFIVGATALSTQSSVATMPTNIEVVKKIGVSDEVRSVSLPIGTVLNMQGNIIQTTLKVILLYTLYNMPFDNIRVFALAIGAALITSIVSGGVPGGGVMGNMMLVSLYNFPVTAFPIIVAIEWMLDAPATAMNALGNTATMPLIDKVNKFSEKEKGKKK